MAVYLGDRFGQTFLVENKPGGGSVIAARELGKAAPDGYTLAVFEPLTATINPYVYATPPYDPADLMMPVTKLFEVPQGIFVSKESPIHDFEDFLKYVKENPGVGFATPGPTSPTYLGFSEFIELANIDMKHIPYRGSGPAMTDLMGGHLPIAVLDYASVAPNIRADKIRPIVIASKDRISPFPDIPTYSESGFEGYTSTPWYGLFTTAGTPPAVVETLNRAMHDMLKDGDFVRWAEDQSMVIVPSEKPEDFEKVIKEDQEFYSAAIKRLGISVD